MSRDHWSESERNSVALLLSENYRERLTKTALCISNSMTTRTQYNDLDTPVCTVFEYDLTLAPVLSQWACNCNTMH